MNFARKPDHKLLDTYLRRERTALEQAQERLRKVLAEPAELVRLDRPGHDYQVREARRDISIAKANIRDLQQKKKFP